MSTARAAVARRVTARGAHAGAGRLDLARLCQSGTMHAHMAKKIKKRASACYSRMFASPREAAESIS